MELNIIQWKNDLECYDLMNYIQCNFPEGGNPPV